MSIKTIPGSAINRRSPFPEGHFRGLITETEDAESRAGNMGFVAFQLTKNTAVEAEREPGQRPHFVRIPTWLEIENGRGQKETVTTSECDWENEETPFAIRNAVSLFGQLAIALGVGERQVDGGVILPKTLEDFIDQLRQGEFDGEAVEFVVAHRPERNGKGQVLKGGRTFVDTNFVAPEADADTAETAEPEEDEETNEEDAEDTEDTVEETEETEEEAPAPPARRLVQSAAKRQATTKASGERKGSGKSRFVRRGGKR